MPSGILYSIVIPVYRGEKFLKELYERVKKVFDTIDGDFELIMVEDNGGDNSWEVMRSLRNRDKRVLIIRLTKNYGQHNALMCGFSHASGDFIITMDDDLQTPPEEFPKLIQAISDSEYDVVYGIPETRRHSLIRNLGSSLFRRMMTVIFPGLPRTGISNFRIARKAIVDHVLNISTPNPLVGVLLLKVTERSGSINVDHHERKHGSSTYTGIKLIRHFLNGIIYNSTLPLKGIFYMGVMTIISSILLGCYYLTLYLMGRLTVAGWMTNVMLLLFFSGILMFSVGIIGEYLLRIIQEVDHTPTYFIRDKEI